MARTRDADALEAANFNATLKRLGGESSCVAVEEMGHWACGWVQYILVKPTARAKLRIARDIKTKLEDYPVVCEETFSEEENNRFMEWAKSELGKHEGWENAVYEAQRNHNSGVGDSTAESEIIETARVALSFAGKLRKALAAGLEEDTLTGAAIEALTVLVSVIDDGARAYHDAKDHHRANRTSELAARIDGLRKQLETESH